MQVQSYLNVLSKVGLIFPYYIKFMKFKEQNSIFNNVLS